MTSKVRIKAISSNVPYVTKGNEYEVLGNFGGEKWGAYLIKMDDGLVRSAHKSHFTIIPDEPAIEVGSEWLSQNNVTWRVVYSGKSIVVTHGNTENTLRREKFLEKYKLKPKTVTMYFYKLGVQLCACELKPASTPILFTREIELP